MRRVCPPRAPARQDRPAVDPRSCGSSSTTDGLAPSRRPRCNGRPPRAVVCSGVVPDAAADDRIDALLEGLNAPQREAVTHGEGPLLILAGAGSGKTRVLTHRIACLVQTGRARAGEILAITFTNKAAQEMRERVELLLGRAHPRDVGDDLPRRLRADAARRGAAARLHAPVHDLRRGRLAPAGQALPRRARASTPSASRRGAMQRQISDAKNKLRDAEDYRQLVGSLLRADRRRRLRALRARAAPHERDGLRRPARPRGQRARAVPGGPRPLRGRLPPRPRRRVPGHQPRPVPLAAAAGRRAPQPGGGRRRRQSIYGFRGADIRNILDFEDDYPDAHVVKLEQNYRSTQTILGAANAVIAHNRGQMGKSLWTDLGEGDPIEMRELDDEHAEARFVVGEIERLVDEGVSRAEIAVFYRTNAQSRVLEDTLVRARDRLPGHRRHEVLRARRDQGRDRLPDRAGQPAGRRRRSRGSPTRRGAGSGRRRCRACSRTRRRWASRSGTPRPTPATVPGLGTAAVRALRALHGDDGRPARARRGAGRRSATCSRRCCTRPATSTRSRPSARSRRRAGIENLEELVEVAREFDATAPEDDTLDEFLQQIALRRRRRHAPRRRGPRDADDAAQRQGPRVPDRLHHRLRGGRLPALARARRGRRSRRSAGSATSASRARCATSTLTYARRRARVRRAARTGLPQPLPDEIPRDLDRPDGTRSAIGAVAGAADGRPRASRGRSVAVPSDAGGRASGWATTSSTPRSATAS